MKSPSKNMNSSMSGQGQSIRMKPPMVGRQVPETEAGRIVPGESNVSPKVGKPLYPDASEYAGAVGGHFGNGRVTR
jgi:hypothetical protein